MKSTILLIKSVFCALLFLIFSCGKTEDINPKIELSTPIASATTGSSITKVIGTSAATLDLTASGIKITVPSGAMAAGAALIATPTGNALDADGPSGFSLEGTWTKPITVSISKPSSDAANTKLYVRLANGLWISSQKNTISGNTLSVRLGPNSGSTIKNGRIMAKKYDLAFAKDFYLKPNVANLDLGASQQFTAYAREGKVPFKYKGSDGKTHYVLDDDEDIAPLAPQVKADDDDEVVPLAKSYADEDVVPLARSTSISDDDEIVPLAVHVKEYPFSSKKAGFERSWKLSNTVGAVSQTGSYTAPKDEASKGKTTTVTFSSTKSATGQQITASAMVRIKGLKKLKGKFKIRKDYTDNYLDINKKPGLRKETELMEATVIIEQDPGVTGWESYDLQHIKILSASATMRDENSYRVDESTTVAPDGIVVFDKAANIKHGGSVLFDIYAKDNKHSLNFYFSTGDVCSFIYKVTLDGKTSTQTSNTHRIVLGSDHDSSLKFPNLLSGKHTEKRSSTVGSSKKETITTYEWQFEEEK